MIYFLHIWGAEEGGWGDKQTRPRAMAPHAPGAPVFSYRLFSPNSPQLIPRLRGTAGVWRHQALSPETVEKKTVLRSCGSWRFQGRLSHRIRNCPHFSIPVHCMNKLKLKMWTQKTISSGQPEEPCHCGDLHVTRCLLTAIQHVLSVWSG